MNEKTKRFLIIGVAIFCLLVFSISPAVMGFFTQMFLSDRLGSIQMPNGQKVAIEIEDNSLAGRLSRLELTGGAVIAPFAWLSASAGGGERDRIETLMILRRAAISSGIDVSDDEVEKALGVGKQLVLQADPSGKAEDYNPLHLVRGSGVTSMPELKLLIREALRISSFVYFEIMGGLDAGEGPLSEFVRKDRETLLLSYAKWSAKPLVEAYKKKPPSDKDLLAWIAKLEDRSLKSALVDDVHVAWDLVYGDYKELDTKPLAEWTKGMAPVGDAEIEQFYDQNKEALYLKPIPEKGDEEGGKKTPGEKTPDKKKTPEDKQDGDKQDEHGGLIQDAAKKPGPAPAADSKSGAASGKAQDGKAQDGKAESDADKQEGEVTPPPPDVAVGPMPLQQGPEFIPLDEVKDQIRRRLEVSQLIEGILRKAQDAYSAHLAAKKDPKEQDPKEEGPKKEEPKKKEPEKKGEFSLKTWLADQFDGGKLPKGLLHVSIPKAARPESFRESQPYGLWEGSYILRQTFGKGEIGPDVQMAKNGAFFYQITDRLEDVVRPIEEIRIEAQEIYASQKALEEMKDKAEAFRKLVRQKAESLLADKVAEKRKACQEKIDKDLADWKQQLEKSIVDTEKEVQSGELPARSVARRKASVKAWKEELTKADDKRAEAKKEEEEALEKDLLELIKPKMAEAYELALKESGNKAHVLGPFPKDANKSGRFSLLDDGPRKFLQGDATVLKAEKGWISDVMEDAPDQSFYVLRMDERKEGGMELVTRRAMAERRSGFSEMRFNSILINAYSPEAIKARFKYRSSTNPGAKDKEAEAASKAEDKDQPKK